MTAVGTITGRDQALRLLVRYVSGEGIEIGPGHAPFPLPYPGTTARYVDRWKPDENLGLFPELGDAAVFAMPDIIADLNVDRLSMLADGSQDFVIASHVLEHLVDPLAHLAEIHRVLRPGGVALILLPDRQRTLDRDRPATTLEHLLADHASGLREADNAHVEEFLRCGGGWNEAWDAAERAAQFDYHRQRSFHMHCWTQAEFLPALRYSITDMDLSWELIDALFVDDVPNSIEFGFILRRSLSQSDPAALGRRLDGVWHELVESRRDRNPPDRVSVAAQTNTFRRHPAVRNVRRLLRPVRRVASTLLTKAAGRAKPR